MKRFNPITLVLGLCLAFAVAPLAHGQTFADTIIPVSAGSCPGSGSATFVALAAAGAGTGMNVVGTANTPVYQVSTSGAATATFSCDLICPGRMATGKGCTAIAGFAFFYGPITTSPTSESAPACVVATFPAPVAAETGSVAAGVAVPSTPFPAVASANLTALTTGQFYTQYVAITTPPQLPAAGLQYQKLWCTFAFVQGAASAMQVNTPGGVIFTTQTISWLRQHRKSDAVNAMMRQGMSKKTAELVFAHYQPRYEPCSPKSDPHGRVFGMCDKNSLTHSAT